MPAGLWQYILNQPKASQKGNEKEEVLSSVIPLICKFSKEKMVRIYYLKTT
jgi:hypothetical protein